MSDGSHGRRTIGILDQHTVAVLVAIPCIG
jgi:hypothetical protein